MFIVDKVKPIDGSCSFPVTVYILRQVSEIASRALRISEGIATAEENAIGHSKTLKTKVLEHQASPMKSCFSSLEKCDSLNALSRVRTLK